MTAVALRQPASLKILSNGFLVFWCLVAAFPIVWIAIMSVKTPLDAFAANPFRVIAGPNTRDTTGGRYLSAIRYGGATT